MKVQLFSAVDVLLGGYATLPHKDIMERFQEAQNAITDTEIKAVKGATYDMDRVSVLIDAARGRIEELTQVQRGRDEAYNDLKNAKSINFAVLLERCQQARSMHA